MKAEYVAVAAAILLLAALLYSSQSPPAPAQTPTPTPAQTPTTAQSPAPTSPQFSPTPAPLPTASPTPSLPQNFEQAWNMSSLEFHPELPSSSFPDPPPKVNKTGGTFMTFGGKPLILLFTIQICPRCEWEKPVFRETMAEFNGSVAVKEISADVAPFEYQPLFINYSTSSQVPLILMAGVYSRTGSNEQSGVCDCISRPEEKGRLEAAVCMLFPAGEAPQPCHN